MTCAAIVWPGPGPCPIARRGSDLLRLRTGCRGGALDARPGGVGGFLDARPGGVGGFLDVRPGGVGGFLDVRAGGVGGFLDARAGGVGGLLHIRAGCCRGLLNVGPGRRGSPADSVARCLSRLVGPGAAGLRGLPQPGSRGLTGLGRTSGDLLRRLPQSGCQAHGTTPASADAAEPPRAPRTTSGRYPSLPAAHI
jgi:hypothetical protein